MVSTSCMMYVASYEVNCLHTAGYKKHEICGNPAPASDNPVPPPRRKKKEGLVQQVCIYVHEVFFSHKYCEKKNKEVLVKLIYSPIALITPVYVPVWKILAINNFVPQIS